MNANDYNGGFMTGYLLSKSLLTNADDTDDDSSSKKWTYPSDWLQMSDPAENQVKLLVAAPYGGTRYKKSFSLRCHKSIHIDWGDGSSSTVKPSTKLRTVTKTYKQGTGHIASRYSMSEEDSGDNGKIEKNEQWIITITFGADTEYISSITGRSYMFIYAIKAGHVRHICYDTSHNCGDFYTYYMKICNGDYLYLGGPRFSSLRKLELPKSMTKLGDYALAYCPSLFDVDLSNITELGSYALDHCYSIDASGKMPKLIKAGKYAFSNSKLTGLDFPALEEIGDYAFSNCYHLESITIPEKVITIPKYCFSSCHNLSQITLQNVTLIDEYAFTNCLTLSAIKDNKITNIMNYAFDNCHNLRSVYLPCCNSIGDRAFRGCSSLCDVTLQSGCEFNSDSTTLRTFYECKMLDHIKYSTESEESTT